jgi:hypothetical protein
MFVSLCLIVLLAHSNAFVAAQDPNGATKLKLNGPAISGSLPSQNAYDYFYFDINDTSSWGAVTLVLSMCLRLFFCVCVSRVCFRVAFVLSKMLTMISHIHIPPTHPYPLPSLSLPSPPPSSSTLFCSTILSLHSCEIIPTRYGTVCRRECATI